MLRLKNWCAAAALLAVALVPVACSQKSGGGTGGEAVTLTGAGATFPYPLYSKWFEMYRQKTGVQINYQSIGSGGGIQQVRAGTVDFGASDAPLADSLLQQMPRPVLHFPTVAGAVVLAYNVPDVAQAIQLTPAAIVDIFMGRIKKWNDPKIAAANPGMKLPASNVLPVHRSDGSGTTNIFVTYLSAVSPEWKSKVGAGTSVSWPAGVGGKGNEGVSGTIQQTPGAIGYVELAYALQNSLPVAHIQNASGKFIAPSLVSTTAAVTGFAPDLAQDVRSRIVNSAAPDAYPIAGLTYLLVYQETPDAKKAKALAEFLQWAMSEGQQAVEQLSYAKLPEGVIQVNRANLDKLTAGGKPVLAAK
ncbi:MAG TPA: phosphate ABC transporter substrate-binding protein PstS [Candidatus Limnocylindrales bacterium]|nr:phosphate ABC transporter substrate-binding protein PstS [Candidatus Limnocylindrales bacterium]